MQPIESIRQIKSATTATLDSRLWSRTTYQCNSKCIMWNGSTAWTGYGQVTVIDSDGKHRSMLCHRLAWILVHGFLSSKVMLHHTCRHKRCLNLNHILPVANEQEHKNIEKLTKDYRKRGFYQPLDAEDVAVIGVMVQYGFSNTIIARANEVSMSTVAKYKQNYLDSLATAIDTANPDFEELILAHS